MFRVKGHREAGAGMPATEWTLLAAAGEPAQFHTKEEAESLVTMCNAALAHSAARIWYTVEEAPAAVLPAYGELVDDYAPDARRVPIVATQQPQAVPVGGLPWQSSASWPVDDSGAPVTT